MIHPPKIHFDDVSLDLGETRVIRELTTTLEAGQWHCVLGRSGIGKSSLLRLMAGLIAPNSGSIQIADKHLHATHKMQSLAALMAQDDGLLPWLNCIDNIQLGPTLRAEKNRHTAERAKELLQQVGLAGYANALPASLSGGMRQRVALARTLMEEKSLVLLDEPFSRLDAITRHELQSLAFELLHGKTVVMVTHDPSEAIRLSNNAFVMDQGSVTQLQRIYPEGSPPRDLKSTSALSGTALLWSCLQEGVNPDACQPQGNAAV